MQRHRGRVSALEERRVGCLPHTGGTRHPSPAPCGQARGGDSTQAPRLEALSARVSSPVPGPPLDSGAESPAALSGDGQGCGRRTKGLPNPGMGERLGWTEISGSALGLRGNCTRSRAPETGAGDWRGRRVPRGWTPSWGHWRGRRSPSCALPYAGTRTQAHGPGFHLPPAGLAPGARGVGKAALRGERVVRDCGVAAGRRWEALEGCGPAAAAAPQWAPRAEEAAGGGEARAGRTAVLARVNVFSG